MEVIHFVPIFKLKGQEQDDDYEAVDTGNDQSVPVKATHTQGARIRKNNEFLTFEACDIIVYSK